MDREELGSILNNYFNKGGLDTLCFELGIDYRDFSSYLLKGRIAEFLVIVDQENKQSELEQIIKRDRHFLINETKKTINTDYQGLVLDNLDTIDRVTLLKLVSTEFTYAEIQTIAIDLEVNETTLVGRTKIERVRELIVQVEDRGDLPLMKHSIYEHYSGNNPIKSCLL